MPKIKLPKDVVEEAWEDDQSEHEGVKLTLVEKGDWVSDAKWEHCELIFKFGDKFYSATAGRSGSYWTDYTYNWEYETEIELREVEKREVVKTEWVAV